ncbi:MAG TPA: D-alanyl-D-alanine carboxypeptidase/D-alanyl-D-alanine-endopeptidase, partial [Terriglobales bacterium]|nr:D-alanyl-D-alanine carboxypeptidase/D-alanyl-D-alanine-endopeptidase [Terriglobales bacterium]
MKGVRRSVVCRFFCIVALSFATTVPAGAAQAAKSEPAKASKAASREPDSKPESKQEKQRREQISKNIQQILSDPLADRSFWGIQAVSLDTGRVLYEFNSGKLFTPASNTKLFTTAAALALIGPAYQFRTTVETTGALDRYGRVNGDIVLVGRGDPNLSGRVLPYHSATGGSTSPQWVLEDLADQLVQKGVKFVDGSVIGDDSFFAFERYGEGWSQEDAVWEWGAPVSALTFNDNSVLVTLQPGDHPGDKAFASVTPFSELFQIDNRVVTTPAGTGPARVALAREPGSNLLSISGSIPAGDSGLSYSLAINDPAEFAAQIFRAILVRKGIVVYGSSRARHAAPAGIPAPQAYQTPGGGDASAHAPLPFMVLATHESHPLAEDLTIINKESLNLHAEIMLRLLG